MGLAVLTLGRQIGLLNRRLPPFGAAVANMGPEIGDAVPRVVAADTDGAEFVLGALSTRPTLLVFVAPGCKECAKLAPAIKSLARSERRRIEVIMVSLAEDARAVAAFRRSYHLRDVRLVASQEIADVFGVATAPYALLISEEGRLASKGIVNNLEQLASLVNANELGIATIESLLDANQSHGYSVTGSGTVVHGDSAAEQQVLRTSRSD